SPFLVREQKSVFVVEQMLKRVNNCLQISKNESMLKLFFQIVALRHD
ncbi:unnamed protein product, partial [Heterotrigona itama]